MSWFFGAFRTKPGPSLYDAVHSPADHDAVFLTVTGGIVIIAVTYVFTHIHLLLNAEGILKLFKVCFAFAVTEAILVGIVGQHWKSCHLETRTPYTPTNGKEINASISVYVGLKHINITLLGIPENQHGERIHYNERLTLFTDVAKDGLQTDYRTLLQRAGPHAVLKIAEHLTVDGGSLRWGRMYRLAGYYTHNILWTSLACWLVTCLVFYMCPDGVPMFMLATGFLQLAAIAVYILLQPTEDFVVPFKDSRLVIGRLDFCWCFWTIAGTCSLLIIIGTCLAISRSVLPEVIDCCFQFPGRAYMYEEDSETRAMTAVSPVSHEKRGAGLADSSCGPSRHPSFNTVPAIHISTYDDATPANDNTPGNVMDAGATPWPDRFNNTDQDEPEMVHLGQSLMDSGMRSDRDSGLPSGSELASDLIRPNVLTTTPDTGHVAHISVFSDSIDLRDNPLKHTLSNQGSTTAQYGSDVGPVFRNELFSTGSGLSNFLRGPLHHHNPGVYSTPTGDGSYLGISVNMSQVGSQSVASSDFPDGGASSVVETSGNRPNDAFLATPLDNDTSTRL